MNRFFQICKIIILLFIFTSCNNNRAQIEQLQKENEMLKLKIEKFHIGYLYMSKVIPEKREIILGEECVAEVGLLIIDENNPTITTLDSVKSEEGHVYILGDTLTNNWGITIYRFKPDKAGRYECYTTTKL